MGHYHPLTLVTPRVVMLAIFNLFNLAESTFLCQIKFVHVFVLGSAYS